MGEVGGQTKADVEGCVWWESGSKLVLGSVVCPYSERRCVMGLGAVMAYQGVEEV